MHLICKLEYKNISKNFLSTFMAVVSFRECKHKTDTCFSSTICCWWPSKSEFKDSGYTCSVNSSMHKVIKKHLKLKNFYTLSDPAQLSNSSTGSESVSCGQRRVYMTCQRQLFLQTSLSSLDGQSPMLWRHLSLWSSRNSGLTSSMSKVPQRLFFNRP